MAVTSTSSTGGLLASSTNTFGVTPGPPSLFGGLSGSTSSSGPLNVAVTSVSSSGGLLASSTNTFGVTPGPSRNKLTFHSPILF